MAQYRPQKQPHRKYPTIISMEGYKWNSEDRSFTATEGNGIARPPAAFSIFSEEDGYIAFESHDLIPIEDDPTTDVIEHHIEIFKSIDPLAPVQYVKYICAHEHYPGGSR